jgi:hypothetical protein
MQDFIPGVFATIVVVSLLSMIIGPIAPSLFRFGRKERPTRKRIFFLSLATLIASFVGFGMTMPEPTPEEKAARAEAAAKAKADQEAAAKAKLEATHNEIVQLWTRIVEVGRECDGTRKRVVAALEKADRYGAYERASRGSAICLTAYNTVRNMEAPSGLEGEPKGGIEKAFGTCADAYLWKKIGFDDLQKVIDGDARPSVVSAAKERAEASQMLTMQCAAQYLAAGHAAGVPLERISAAGNRPGKE